ncbi:uncharacterized protein LOC121764253 [Salvia splendens]|uniref:uncharacterized protein LOC121764253 n=1 Tax=Salvia splendens TaxID=180675 RepID=UPI001C26DCD3|nr:uncharacterized protein LOC121764253 [Salvia splendens]
MEKYLTKSPRLSSGSSSIGQESQVSNQIIDKDEIEANHGKRSSIASYDVNIHDRIRREYVAKGLPFRGHDESPTPLNQGNFLEMFKWYGLRHDEVGKVILKNTIGNNQLTSPAIQKDVVRASAFETTLEILRELGDRFFSIMVDESRDCSAKEKMAIVIRFVNVKGEIIDRFLALVHFKETKSICLKEAIDSVFAKFELSLSKVRGQGYDGASIMRGKGKNQEISLKRPGDTRWGFHYASVTRLESMWPLVTEVLQNVLVDGMIQPLSCALQERDQDILNAIYLIENAKESLRSFREDGWDTFLQHVDNFCGANDITVTKMDDVAPKRICMRNGTNITNYHHYRIEIFCQVIDLLMQEMENRCSESSTDLLRCMSFPKDFSSNERIILLEELVLFDGVMRKDDQLIGIENLGGLARKMVETKKDIIFPLVYHLIEFVLLLPVATASVERVFSDMKIVKTDRQNRMGDEWLNDSLVIYSERSIFATVSNERILTRFQDIDTRRSQLSRLTDASAT